MMNLFKSIKQHLAPANEYICNSCGSPIKTDSVYMINGKKLCPKCYEQEKKKQAADAKQGVSLAAKDQQKQEERNNCTENEERIMEEQKNSEKSGFMNGIPLLRYSAKMSADPSHCCFLRDRTASMISRFNAERTQNGTYMAESNSIPFQVKGIITYSREDGGIRNGHFLDVETKVQISCKEFHVYREETESWWTNYHDESDSITKTVPIDPEAWDKEGWFSDPKWTGLFQGPKTKEPLPAPSTDTIPYDALYYEGYDRRGIFILYLRRCTEGYRLLKIHQERTEEPVEIGFSEKEIQALYQHVSDNRSVTMFQDFLLNNLECAKINVYAECDKNPKKLPALDNYGDANPDRFVSFFRKSGTAETETYSISSLMITGLLWIRGM